MKPIQGANQHAWVAELDPNLKRGTRLDQKQDAVDKVPTVVMREVHRCMRIRPECHAESDALAGDGNVK
jgi:hypothetical protein